MLEEDRLAATGTTPASLEAAVQPWTSGRAAKGEFHCSSCRYGVTVHTVLPVCPMCRGRVWVQTAWSPLGRAIASSRHPSL